MANSSTSAAVATTNVAGPPASTSSTGNASSASSAQSFHTASLYVGDLLPDVTEALLFEIFNAVGPVASIRVCRDAVTRRSLGYAYVNFHNVADAERALDTMNYNNIKTQPCRIMWSQRDPSLRRSGVGNIFVKNLDTSIDNKALYDTFSLFGNIMSCKVAYDSDNNSKGYGYVHYETAEGANEAIQKINGMLIAGKEVFVGHFQRRNDRDDVDEWTNCYVKNIPTHFTDADLKSLFEPFGEVSSCIAVPNADGKGNKGFGFVNFEESDSARKAVEMLNKKNLPCEDGSEIELYVGKAQKKNDRERDLRQQFEAMKMERISKYEGVNLYVKNLDDQISDDDLREAFAVHGTLTSTHIMKDNAGISRGFGFVCFSSPEEATKAATEMNGKLLSGKPIYVALAQRREVRRAQLEAQHAQRAVGMGGPRGMPMGQPPMFGAAPMFYAQPNQMPPQARQGFMYPHQMMPPPRGVGVPRGPMPYGGGGGVVPGYQMPPFGMPMQHRQPRRQRVPGGRGGGPMPRGGGGGAHHMGPQSRNFKYTSNVRNQPAVDGMQLPHHPQQMAGGVPMMPGGGGGMMPHPPVMEPLTPAALAAASPEQQKNMIGERLYPMIHSEQPELAGKITGMLLEMDNGELLHLMESPEALGSKINEAIQVLQAHSEPAASE